MRELTKEKGLLEGGIKVEHIRRFLFLTRALDKLMREIDSYNPKAELYVSDGGISLMRGPSHHEGTGRQMQVENEVEHVKVISIDGGGW